MVKTDMGDHPIGNWAAVRNHQLPPKNRVFHWNQPAVRVHAHPGKLENPWIWPFEIQLLENIISIIKIHVAACRPFSLGLLISSENLHDSFKIIRPTIK